MTSPRLYPLPLFDKTAFVCVCVPLFLLLSGCLTVEKKPDKGASPREAMISDFRIVEVGDRYAIVSFATLPLAQTQVKITDFESKKVRVVKPNRDSRTNIHSIRIDGLKPDHQYVIAVRASNANGTLVQQTPSNIIKTSP
ncbi:MAG: fibronectin type III domain-containing protein [Bdellovibrionales bacterium]